MTLVDGPSDHTRRLSECPFCGAELVNEDGRSLAGRHLKVCEAFRRAWGPDAGEA